MKKFYLLISSIIFSISIFGQTVTWNFGTGTTPNPAPSSGTPVPNLTVSDVTQGNNNGTTALLTTISTSSGYTGASGSYNAGAAARIGALNTAVGGSAYFEFTLTPAAGSVANLTAINFGSRSTGTGPKAYTIRTSLDDYATSTVTGTLSSNSTWALYPNILSISSAAGTSVTIRIYGYDGTGSAGAGTANWRIDDLSITISVTGGSPSISVAAGSNAAEPSSNGSFAVSFSTATSGSVTFDYALTGTATFTSDYSVTLSAGATPSPLTAASGMITVPASTTSVTATVTPVNDALAEPTETIILTLSNPAGGYTLGAASANITLADDDVLSTPIHTIQGSGAAATAGSFTVEAIVTGIYPTLSPAGFYIQEEDADADADPNTSEGIFVVSATSVAVGDKVRVAGDVQENASTPSFNQAVFATATVTILTNGNPVPSTVDVSLPVTAATDYEKYEGMRVRFPGTLTVSDNDRLGNFGELKLSANGLVYQPTQLIDPNDNPASGTNSSGTSNVAAINALMVSNTLRTIILDDGRGGVIPNLPYVNADNTVRVGSTADNITGILGFAFSQYRIQPIAATLPSFNYAPRPPVPGYGIGANLKIASFNVLNYFNGNGAGGGFPTTRGANSATEFNRQRDKIINAIAQINADVVGLIEIENLDGNDVTPALLDLVNGLNSVLGAGTYSLIDDDLNNDGSQDNNTDQIRCAIIYKSAVVTPVGAAMLANNAAFDRPPLVQTFNLTSTNIKFNFIVNHFKSKGGTGTGLDADQGDGQAAFNDRRKQQASALINFISTTVTPTSGTDRVISVGDYNAYYEEDPLDILRAANYTVASSATSYSYLFEGQVGSLDHAVLSPSVTPTLTSITKWNANAAEPTYLDYNDAVNDGGGDVVNPWAGTYTPSPWRASDHDAVVLGFNFPVTLPVTLTHFSAVMENDKSKITWVTAQEVNTREFVIERSVSGANWQVIAKVAAAGNSTTTTNYELYDSNPLNGTNLYRLKSVDTDGKFAYSAIIKIYFGNSWQMTISPNPAKNILYLQSSQAGKMTVSLYDAAGRKVKQFSALSFVTGETKQLTITGIGKGLYILETHSGKNSQVNKLVVE